MFSLQLFLRLLPTKSDHLFDKDETDRLAFQVHKEIRTNTNRPRLHPRDEKWTLWVKLGASFLPGPSFHGWPVQVKFGRQETPQVRGIRLIPRSSAPRAVREREPTRITSSVTETDDGLVEIMFDRISLPTIMYPSIVDVKAKDGGNIVSEPVLIGRLPAHGFSEDEAVSRPIREQWIAVFPSHRVTLSDVKRLLNAFPERAMDRVQSAVKQERKDAGSFGSPICCCKIPTLGFHGFQWPIFSWWAPLVIIGLMAVYLGVLWNTVDVRIDGIFQFLTVGFPFFCLFLAIYHLVFSACHVSRWHTSACGSVDCTGISGGTSSASIFFLVIIWLAIGVGVGISIHYVIALADDSRQCFVGNAGGSINLQSCFGSDISGAVADGCYCVRDGDEGVECSPEELVQCSVIVGSGVSSMSDCLAVVDDALPTRLRWSILIWFVVAAALVVMNFIAHHSHVPTDQLDTLVWCEFLKSQGGECGEDGPEVEAPEGASESKDSNLVFSSVMPSDLPSYEDVVQTEETMAEDDSKEGAGQQDIFLDTIIG